MADLERGDKLATKYEHHPPFRVCAGIDEFYIGEGPNRLEFYVCLADCSLNPRPKFNHNHNRHVTSKVERSYFIENWLMDGEEGRSITAGLRFGLMFKNGREIVVNGDSFEIVAPRLIRHYLRDIDEDLSTTIGFDGSVPSDNVISIENGLSDYNARAIGYVKPKNLRGRVQRAPRYGNLRRALELVRGADVVGGELRRGIEANNDVYRLLVDERMTGLWFGRTEIPIDALKLPELRIKGQVSPGELLERCRRVIRAAA